MELNETQNIYIYIIIVARVRRASSILLISLAA